MASEQTEYTYDVFISHSHENGTWVREWLLPRLEAAGLRVCIDFRDFDIGVPRLVNMEWAVDSSRHTLLVLTTAWVRSQWAEFEALLTQTTDPAARQRRLLPLLLESCQPPGRIATLTHADFTQQRDWETQLGRIVATMRSQPQSRDRIPASATGESYILPESLQDLLVTVRNERAVACLTPEHLKQLARHSPKTMAEYRLGRIAEWSQARYQLDLRFVQLTLLVDQGENAQTTRWQETRRFRNLSTVLAEVPEPVVVLLGPPGSGKTTLLRRLQLDHAIDRLCDEEPRLTFFIQLNQYRAARLNDPPPPPLQWLAQRWQHRYPDLPALEYLLSQGRMLLLLDALNEMPHHDPADYREKIGLWRHFLHESIRDRPGNRVVFSCRTLDYSAPLSSKDLRVPQVRIEILSPEQVHEFLMLYVPTHAETIWRELDGSPLLNLYRTPYFLRLLAEQVKDGAYIPTGLTELFTGFVRQALRREIEGNNRLFLPNGLLTERDWHRVSSNSWRNPYDLPERGPLIPKLNELAFRMQIGQFETESVQVRTGYDAACDLLNHDRAEDILRAGISLNVLDEDTVQDEILFFHQLLQEYFAARYLASNPQYQLVKAEWRADSIRPILEEQMTQIADSDPLPLLPATGWEETMRLATAMNDEPNAFIRGLMGVNLSLAGKCAALPDVETREKLMDEIRDQLITRIKDPGTDLRARIVAGSVLGELGDPRFERCTGLHDSYLMPQLVLILADSYLIGSNDYDAEMPPHSVTLETFEIGQFPVTNAEYRLFIDACGYEDEIWWDTPAAKAWQLGIGTAEGQKQQWREGRRTLQKMLKGKPGWNRLQNIPHELLTEAAPKPPLPGKLTSRLLEADDPIRLQVTQGRITTKQADYWTAIACMGDEDFEALLDRWYPAGRLTEPDYWHDELFNGPAQPVVGICWYEARAYCAWLSAQIGKSFRLPTEVEWEAAARGAQGRRYPYGVDFIARMSNTFESHIRHTTPVGVFPGGVTPEGCADMSGNVWEWTSSVFERYPYEATDRREDLGRTDIHRVLRGGSWNDVWSYSRAACRFHYDPSTAIPVLGLSAFCLHSTSARE